MDIRDFLELKRAFEGDREGRSASEIEYVAHSLEPFRQFLDRVVVLQHFGRAGRHFADQFGKPRLIDGTDRLASACRRDGEAGEYGQLAGEGLGRGDADFRAGVGREDDIGFARDGALGHIHDRSDVLFLLAAIAQGRQGVRRFARLRDEDRQASLGHRRLAITEFGSDIDLDRHPRDALQPYLGDETGIIGRAAGDDGNPRHFRQIEIKVRQADGPLQRMEIGIQCIADHTWLLMDLLEHEVAVIAFFHGPGIDGRKNDRPIDDLVLFVPNSHAFAGELSPVAVLEIDDLVGQGREREGVRAEIHLPVADADGERRSLACADHQFRMVAEDEGDREGALKPFQRF